MNAKTILAFLGGAAVGAAVALLVAPTSGKELRANIAVKGDELKQQIEQKLKGLNNPNEDGYKKMKERIENILSETSSITEEIYSLEKIVKKFGL